MTFKSFAYPAIVKRLGKKHAIVFPDLPECIGTGGTVQESAMNAEKSLFSHLEGIVHGGRLPPRPSSLDDIFRSRKTGELAFMLIRAEIGPKVVRINISLDEAILARADRQAASQGYTRSGYIASLIREDSARRAKHAKSRRRTG